MFSILPKEEQFYTFFATQASHNVEAARVFREMIANWSLESPGFDKLRDIEHEADITTHEIIDKLNRTFITPFDREDINALASELDDVVDLVQSLSSRMRLFRVEKTNEDLAQLAGILTQSCECVLKAVKEMAVPDKSRRVLDYCIEINRLENAGDNALDAALGRLFSGRPDPLEVMKWKEIFEVTETAIDKCEDVANIIESILVKQG